MIELLRLELMLQTCYDNPSSVCTPEHYGSPVPVYDSHQKMSPLHRLYIIMAWMYIAITILEHYIHSVRAATQELEAKLLSS